jgi:methylated-DNA-[protein]-cysteine S-methyltransferase
MNAQQDAGIYARQSPYLERYVQIGVASGRVLSVSFPETPETEAETDHPLLDRIEAYLEGETEDFDDVDVAMTMATDHREVLEAVRAIPYGESVTVRALAGMVPGLDPDSEDDSMLIRTALDENPTPLIVPDHRVSDGPSAAPPPVEQRLRSLEGL